jgi:hypothetical protein
MLCNAANHSDIKDNSYAYGSKLKYLTETVYKIVFIKVFFVLSSFSFCQLSLRVKCFKDHLTIRIWLKVPNHNSNLKPLSWPFVFQASVTKQNCHNKFRDFL